MSTGIEPSFELMKKRIKSTHIHDNNGEDDQHLYPGQGTINWDKAMNLLTSLPDQFPLVLELKEPAGVEHPINEARKALEELMIQHEQQ